jgi:iron complex transport system substrate-binding protein
VREIFAMLYQVAAMVGEAEQGLARLQAMRARLDEVQALTQAWPRRPRVYFEEWDEPRISAIRWVSELVGMAGGDDCFPELARESLGKNRILDSDEPVLARAPDIIIGSWCGKKFRPENVAARPGWSEVPAVRDAQIFEIKSADILQPGPAALTDGFEQLHALMKQWVDRHA